MAGILEVCVDSIASARAAIAGGADRIELCAALAVGGLTPYAELLRQIRAESNIPVRCLMRPRGGDFLYEKEEILMMAAQIEHLRRLGADGFVIGCLTPEGELDEKAMEPLLKAAEGTGLTLHRCIDVSRDPFRTYLAAKELGIDTVLTSGAAGSCSLGMETIGKLLQLRDESGFPGMKVLQFAFDSREPSLYLPHNCVPNSVCYTGTHDNMTTRQWLDTAPADSVAYAESYMHLGKDPVRDVVRTAMSSVSDLCLIPMQDWLGLGADARMNFPGTMSSNNWTWRAEPGMLTAALAAQIREITARYARL